MCLHIYEHIEHMINISRYRNVYIYIYVYMWMGPNWPKVRPWA